MTMRTESIATCMHDTYDEAQRKWYTGRIDDTDWELFKFYWRNGAPRFSGIAEAYEIREGR